MNKIMTPSEETTTTGQIDKAVANYRAMLEKHASNFATTAVQQVLGQPELAKQQFSVFRTLVEAISKTIVRFAKVDRSRTMKQSIDATGRVQYVNDDVLATMPLGQGDAEAIFVKLGYNVDCDKLDEELGKLGFELIIDPQGLAAINEADQAFADEHPNGIQWKDTNGNYCYAVFNRWDDKRRVNVNQYDYYWYDRWWFPCRRK